MSNKASSGKIWPYAIGSAITLVFGFCVATIVVTSKADLQESDVYMTHYQDADANANSLIKDKINFDKKYKVEYISNGISQEGSDIKYELKDINSNPVNNAKIIVAISRPETNKLNVKLDNPTVENGIYTFSNIKFPKAGVWNIIAKIEVDNESRFLNIKADTRMKEAYEF
jgi:hypothetical protein